MAKEDPESSSSDDTSTVASVLYAVELGLRTTRDYNLAGQAASLRVSLADGAIARMRFAVSEQSRGDSVHLQKDAPSEGREWKMLLKSLLDFVGREAIREQNQRVYREVQELRKSVLVALLLRD